MAKTPLGIVTPYATASDFVQRYDVNTIGDRLQDLGVRVSAANVLTDPNLAKLLLQASGMLESAILRGQRYQIPDLVAALYLADGVTPQFTTGSEYIRGLVCDITLWLVYQRRVIPNQPLPIQATNAMVTLEAIAAGQRIFNFMETARAGVNLPITSMDPNAAGSYKPLGNNTIITRVQDFFGDIGNLPD